MEAAKGILQSGMNRVGTKAHMNDDQILTAIGKFVLNIVKNISLRIEDVWIAKIYLRVCPPMSDVLNDDDLSFKMK